MTSLSSCGTDANDPLRARTCDQPGPAHILPLPAGERFGLLGETAGRVVVSTGTQAGARAHSIGPCGEDPQQLLETGELALDEGRVWILQRDADRVGYWPVEGGAVTWISETPGHTPLGLAPGRGYVVLERATETDASGSAVLVGIDGSRQTLWVDVAAHDDTEVDFSDPEALLARDYRVQSSAGVLAVLDGIGTLRVAHLDDPTAVDTIQDVATFSLGPDGSWFVTRVVESFAPSILDASDATFHARGDTATVALGRIPVSPLVVDPSGWIGLYRPEPGSLGTSPAQAIFVPASRTEVAIPAGFVGTPHTDSAGALYAVVEGSIQRWDPFNGAIETKADVPEGFSIELVNERAALSKGSAGPVLPTNGANAEITIAPLDGGAPWTVPELADAYGLLPDGAVVYSPDVDEDVETAPLFWVDESGDQLLIHGAVPVFWLGVDLVDGDLAFRVEEGEDSGLWRAALP